MLRNRVYIAQVDVPDYGVSTRGDFEPLVSEKVFYRVQAILDGRLEITAPRQRNDLDFPLRGYVRCEACGKPLTASWSKGRRDYPSTSAFAARRVNETLEMSVPHSRECQRPNQTLCHGKDISSEDK